MENHTYLGEAQNGFGAVPLAMSRVQRFEHVAVIGASGVGKSTLLRSIAAADIARGDGLLYLDPHGDEAAALLDLIPAWRLNHVVFLEIANSDWPIAFNVLDCDHADDRAFVADALVSALRDIWFDSMTAAPRMENVLRHAVIALLHVPNATLPLIARLLTDDRFRSDVVARVSNPITRRFFEDRFETWRDGFRGEVIEPILTRLDTVLAFPVMLNCLGQHRRTLRLDHAMQGRRIVIADMSRIGDSAAHLMGALLLARVRTAALARARMAHSQRADFHLIVDELPRFATNSVPALLSEARKFQVSMTYSTQMLATLSERTRAAVLATTGTLAAFRLGPEDGSAIAPKFDELHRDFNAARFNDLERGEALIKIGAADVRRVLCAPPPAGYGLADIARRQSQRHFARPRAQVEQWLQTSLSSRASSPQKSRRRRAV